MKKLTAILIALAMAGCVTGWSQKQRNGLLMDCAVDLFTGFMPPVVYEAYCSCMVNEIEKIHPEYDDAKIQEWYNKGGFKQIGKVCNKVVEEAVKPKVDKTEKKEK